MAHEVSSADDELVPNRPSEEREHLRIVARVNRDGDPETISSTAWRALFGQI